MNLFLILCSLALTLTHFNILISTALPLDRQKAYTIWLPSHKETIFVKKDNAECPIWCNHIIIKRNKKRIWATSREPWSPMATSREPWPPRYQQKFYVFIIFSMLFYWLRLHLYRRRLGHKITIRSSHHYIMQENN